MSGSDQTAKRPKRRMMRCPEGHVFDAAASNVCPTCGRAVASAEGSSAGSDRMPAPDRRAVQQRVWLNSALIGGAVVLVVLAIAVVMGEFAKHESGGPKSVANEPAKPVPPAKPKPDAGAKSDKNRSGKVERWQTVITIGGRKYVCVNVTQPDGRYRLGDDCPPPLAGETGRTTINADGSWTLHADTGRVDHGTIEMIGPDKFISHATAGPSLWTRVEAGH